MVLLYAHPDVRDACLAALPQDTSMAMSPEGQIALLEAMSEKERLSTLVLRALFFEGEVHVPLSYKTQSYFKL